MHFLRQLNKFGISQIILKQFYYAVIKKCFDFLHHCVVWSHFRQGESPAGNTCEVRIQNNRAYAANHWIGLSHSVYAQIEEHYARCNLSSQPFLWTGPVRRTLQKRKSYDKVSQVFNWKL